MTLTDQRRTPLLEAMQRYVDSGSLPFHTPGHKQGKGMHPRLGNLLGAKTLALDLAIMEDLDDLHEPSGPIRDAQDLAAQLYGADHSYFNINGTTGAIYAMILTICGPEDQIIVPRNAHRSIIGGIILSGAHPVFINPEVNNRLGLAMCVTYQAVQQALQKHPSAKGVLLINPNYYGMAADIKPMIDLVHRYNMPVIVDEAHGPHLQFHPQLPQSALGAGADLCAQSTHKILGAMTQCSMLHAMEQRIDIPRLKAMLQLVQSTSPNYILLSSLDVARMQMATQGRALLDNAIELADELRRSINNIPGLYCFGNEIVGQQGVYSIDPTKVTVTVAGLGLSGHEVEHLLRYDYHIQVELSDLYNILFIISIGDGRREIDAVVTALTDLAAKHAKGCDLRGNDQPLTWLKVPPIPEQRLSPREALFAPRRTWDFQQSKGHICGEIVTFYPPGIPVLCPGEVITQDIIDYCLMLKENGLHISGPEDSQLHTIKVVD